MLNVGRSASGDNDTERPFYREGAEGDPLPITIGEREKNEHFFAGDLPVVITPLYNNAQGDLSIG